MLGGFHGVGLIIFLVVVAAIVVLLIYRFSRKPQVSHNDLDRRDSLEILKIRLASGEISPDDYNKLKSVLLS
ncbi:SHOCT domain-containing protein [Deltaproteobacteria bacterium OttesenSCG-928-M10]|nr:SHOCT domain-containing protein [Deltaproteobacteria bacterium OttesenSCG-928-M10]